jgi:hypothetical protein
VEYVDSSGSKPLVPIVQGVLILEGNQVKLLIDINGKREHWKAGKTGTIKKLQRTRFGVVVLVRFNVWKLPLWVNVEWLEILPE